MITNFGNSTLTRRVGFPESTIMAAAIPHAGPAGRLGRGGGSIDAQSEGTMTTTAQEVGDPLPTGSEGRHDGVKTTPAGRRRRPTWTLGRLFGSGAENQHGQTRPRSTVAGPSHPLPKSNNHYLRQT